MEPDGNRATPKCGPSPHSLAFRPTHTRHNFINKRVHKPDCTGCNFDWLHKLIECRSKVHNSA